jgi:hypothetical protein
MKNTNNSNLVSSAKVVTENNYAEFTTLFRIPFKKGDIDNCLPIDFRDVLEAWSSVCITALNMRMDACVSMLFRNRDNVIYANEYEVCFKKNNGMIHIFRHPSFNAMEETVRAFERKDWTYLSHFPAGIAQLRKALYWVSEDQRKDLKGFGFGQLVSCLEELEMGARLNVR